MALLAVSGFVGCSSDSDNDPGKKPEEGTDFSFEVKDLTQGSFGVKIIPQDKEQTYYFNLVTKDVFDSYADDVALQLADYAYMSDLAASLGISLDQLLLEALLKGDQEHSYLALTPETEYVFYSYGISAEGQALTGVNSYAFTTPAPEFMDVNFEITASDITSTSFTLNIQPDNDDCFYYYDVMPASDYEEYCGGSPENVPTFMESYLEALKEEVFSDYTMPQFITEITNRGAFSDSESFSGLLPEYTYYAFAIGLANDGSIVTKASVTPVVTSESPRNEYTVDSEKVGDVTYSAHITASQSEAFAVLFERQYYFPEGTTDAEIINSLYEANGNSFSQFLYADNADVSYSRLIPNEDYYLLIFACNVDGSPKLEEGKINLKKVPVKTAQAAMSSAEYTLTATKVEKTTATVHVSADSQYSDETFVFTYMTKSDYDALQSKVEFGLYDSMDEALQAKMDEYLDASLESWNSEHPNAQMDMKEFLSRSLMDGAGDLCYYEVTGFEPGTEYVLYLFGMKADKSYTTKAFTTEFETVSDEACLASYEDIIVIANDNTEGQTTLYSNWVYVGGSYDKFYGKIFTNTDEWAGKNVSELRTLLQQEPGKSYSGESYATTIAWGDTYYFYTVCYDMNGIPTDVYKITHTSPENGEGATGLSGKEIKVDITTITDASSASAALLNVKDLSGMTTPMVVEHSNTPLKSVDASVLDHLMVRRLTKANR